MLCMQSVGLWDGETTFCVPLPSAFFMAGLTLDADALRGAASLEADGSSLVLSFMATAEATLAEDCLGLRAEGWAAAFGALMACPMPLPR